ncbi:hypothetical protein CA3LBN_003164 [Candidozyma haemuli]|uniref:Transcription initiation factor IIA large subunit n=1 Tax=Candidozyma haemuli TaxID=45357 RepID=A0ABX8IDN4_9ASCO|nr:hypothetical protein CA3LBN_003164 [[Candida] haemuloni]
MSNFEACKLYEAVIEEVITDSRQDFEDSGIDEGTLQDLKKLWCEKLSQSRVGNFSWNDLDDLDGNIHASLISHPVKEESLHVNQELEMPIPQYDPTDGNPTNDLSSHSNSGYSMGIELPTVKQEYTEENGLILPKVNQSDGPIEFTIEADQKNLKWYKALAKRQSDGPNDGLGELHRQSGVVGIGEDDDDDGIFNDSDDINSDLDDELDSEKSDDEDMEQEGQIMLCLYDKVQRVKNKWKCNLKEGVANIDGRDYVFQRATGESEW